MLKGTVIGLMISALLMLPDLAPAADPVVALKIGDVTSYTGNVLVRTKGRWSRLKKVPHPVFSTDKIVTRRGRAEMRFVDSGVLRVNVDSSVSITQQKKTVGFFVKRSVTVRRINVLVGDVYFNVKVEKDASRRYSVRSPSMTAAIRGSDMRMTVNPDFVTYYALLSGEIEARGDYQPHYNPVVMSEEFMGVREKRLPLSTNRKASEDFGLVDKAFNAWARARTVPGVLAPPVKRGPRIFDGMRFLGRAHLETAREIIFEADGFGESSVIARTALKRLEESIGKIEEALKAAGGLSDKASGLSGAAQKAYMAAADSAMYAASAETSRMNADTAVTLAVLSGYGAALDAALNQAGKAGEAADGVQEKAGTASALADEAAEAPPDGAADLALAAEAFMLAAEAGYTNAYAQSNAALQASSGDLASFDAALRYASLAGSLSRTADIAAGNVLAAVRQGNREAIQAAFEGLTEVDAVMQEMNERYMEEGAVIPPPDEVIEEVTGEVFEEQLYQEEPLPEEMEPRLEVPDGVPASPAL